MAVTLKMIAERAGLSVQTVSNVLNDKRHLFREETQKRVLKAADELGYMPNLSARAIRTGRFNAITLLLNTDRRFSYLPPDLLYGVLAGLRTADMHLTISDYPDEEIVKDGFVPKTLRQLMSDGLLINYHYKIPDQMLDLVRKSKYPTVWINSKQKHDSIYPEERDAMRKVAERLIKTGHRRIVYMDSGYGQRGSEPFHYSKHDRYGGYAEAMKAAGLKPVLIGSRQYQEVGRKDVYRELLMKEKRPTAILSYSLWAIESAWDAADDLGLRIPEDLSLATLGDKAAMYRRKKVSFMVQPWHEIGKQAVDMVRKKIEKPSLKLKPRAMQCEFIEGETLAPAPK